MLQKNTHESHHGELGRLVFGISGWEEIAPKCRLLGINVGLMSGKHVVSMEKRRGTQVTYSQDEQRSVFYCMSLRVDVLSVSINIVGGEDLSDPIAEETLRKMMA
jgi:hypothetical protein